MSAMATHPASASAPAHLKERSEEPRLLWYSVSLAWMPILAWLVVRNLGVVHSHFAVLILWVGVYALANLIPVQLEYSRYAPDMPIVVAGALLLSPVEIALISLLGAVDPNEF